MRRPVIVALAGLLVGCGAHVRPVANVSSPAHLPIQAFSGLHTPSITLRPDPALALIARAEKEFTTGESEMRLGHRASAREHFDLAVDLLLTAPGGARTDPALRVEFDRLLDRISALDAQALRAGDGFAETRSEPAVIDELLAVATFERPEKPAATIGSRRGTLVAPSGPTSTVRAWRLQSGASCPAWTGGAASGKSGRNSIPPPKESESGTARASTLPRLP
jgi:hypothetical protein